MKLEFKFSPLDADVAEDGSIAGYASKFGEVDQGADVVLPGAFSKSLTTGRRIKMLWHHDPSQPIGTWDEAKEDENGLRVKGRLNLDVQRGRETYSLIKSGAIDGMSIGYRTVKARKGNKARILEELDVWEVSLVTFPMLVSATVDSVKMLDAANAVEIKRFAEKILREADFSADEAKAAAAAIAKVRGEREAPDHDAILNDIRDAIRGL